MTDIQKISWNRISTRYFWKVLSNFLILTAILLVIFIPIYHQTMRSIKNTSTYALENDLESSFRTVNQKISELVQQAQVIARDGSVSRVTGTEDIDARFPQFCYELSQARQYMSSYSIQSDFIVNAYMLSQYNPAFLSDSIANIDRNLVYGNFYEIEGYTLEEWAPSILNGSSSFLFLPQANTTPVFDPNWIDRKEPILHLVVPINSSGVQSKKAMVYMLSTEALFSNLTLDRFGGKGFVYLTDQQGRIIAAENYNGLPLELSEGVTNLEYRDESVSVIQSHSSETGLSVVLGVPDSYFAAQMHPTQLAISLILTLVIIAALAVSIAMSYHQSRPMAQTVQTLHRVNPDGVSQNAYEYITSTVRELDSQRQYYEQEANMMGVLMQNSYLERLLNGKILTREDTEHCSRLLALPDSPYLCVHFRIWETSLHSEGEAQLDLTAQANEFFRQRLEESGFQVFCHNPEPLSATFLLCLRETEGFDTQALRQLLIQAIQEFRENCGVMIGAGIGEPANSLEEVGWSCKCARSACRTTSLENSAQIFSRKGASPTPVFSLHLAQKLTELINAGAAEDVQKCLDEMISALPVSRALTEDEVCLIYYGLKNILQDETHAILGPGENIRVPELVPDQNIREQVLAFAEPFTQLCSQMQSRQHAETQKRSHEIVRYVEEHFMQSTLCALSIAEYFNVAEKYVFSVLKECTGKSLGDYIEELRLKKAEELLLSEMDIHEIPEQIGYNSINTFYKAFKRVYGTSPGKWRWNNQQTSSQTEYPTPPP